MDAGLGALRILLVDDNQHMRSIVGHVLKGVGVHHVREAKDGASALQTLREWPADIAIVDFRMSPIDGVEFTRLVRNSPDTKTPYLPIIMMTGFADQSRVIEARDAGITELLVKPVTARGVVDRLNSVIYKPRPFIRNETYFGPLRKGIDDLEPKIAPVQRNSSYAEI